MILRIFLEIFCAPIIPCKSFILNSTLMSLFKDYQQLKLSTIFFGTIFQHIIFLCTSFQHIFFFTEIWKQTFFFKNNLAPPPPEIKWCVPYLAPCGEVTKAVASLLSFLWRGYQICGEITCGEVTLWRGYSQLVTGDSPIFRWNQQHFNYILVSVARFLPYFI